MDERKFRLLMKMAKSLQSVDADRADYWIGFQRGVRRAYHGDNFGTEEEHQKYMNCRDGEYRLQLQTGYRAGFYHDQLKGNDIQKLRKILALTTSEMAEILSVSHRTVEGWEQGRPIPDAIIKLIKNHFSIDN